MNKKSITWLQSSYRNPHKFPPRTAEAKPSAVLFFKKVRLVLRVLISLEKFKKDFMKDGGIFQRYSGTMNYNV